MKHIIHLHSKLGTIALWVIAAASAHAITFVQWPSSTGGNDHLYGITDSTSDWNVAEATAVSLGGHLVSITSDAEQSFVASTLVTGQFATLPLQAVELLTNGGFEDEPNFGVNHFPGFSVMTGNQIPGWTIVPGHSVTVHDTTIYPFISGNYSVNTDGEGANGHNADLYQDFSSNLGGNYSLVFDWQGWMDTAPGTKLHVSIVDLTTNAVLYNGLFDFDSVLHHESVSFSGTGNILRLEIQETPESGSNDDKFIVDNFSVNGPVPTPRSNLLNISTRLNVQTGDNVLIGGFIITGTDPKRVIVRGIGPSLGLQGVLADPTLELHEPGGMVVTNDNWRDTQEQEIIATTIPPTNDLESAIVGTLNPGAYTVILAGKNGGTGIGVVEAYDLDQAANSKLANISTRGFVETGDNVMIGGFIIGGGSDASTIVARGIGPSLTTGGVADALQDPTLELHDSNGAIIASNDDWMDSPDKQTIIDDGLAPTNDKESALLATLAPGAYTAIVSGVNNTIGVGLVEAYNLH